MKENPVSMKSLDGHQLAPEMVFWVICEKTTPRNMESEVWQFEVVGLGGVPEVTITFPSGLEGKMFFEEVKIGGVLKVFFDPEKNQSFVGTFVIDILLWD